MNKKILSGVCGVSLLALSNVTHAVPVDITSLTATWFDGNPAANVTYLGDNGSTSATATWGGGTAPSSYNFATAATPIKEFLPPSPTGLFDLGTWSHNNQPIPSGTSITSISLRLDAGISIDGTDQGDFSFIFDFAHNVTP
mgnify:FL=1